jgi:hypothetical protein
MNENWPRWIFASVTKHFDGNLNAYEIFYEGQKRSAENFQTDLIEVRMDGPYYLQLSKTEYNAKIEINLLAQAAIDEKDFHKIHRMVGVVATGFAPGIQVFKYGNGVVDDDSLIGCLDLIQDRQNREFLVINHFGQLDPEKQIMQATVEGHYEIQLTG